MPRTRALESKRRAWLNAEFTPSLRASGSRRVSQSLFVRLVIAIRCSLHRLFACRLVSAPPTMSCNFCAPSLFCVRPLRVDAAVASASLVSLEWPEGSRTNDERPPGSAHLILLELYALPRAFSIRRLRCTEGTRCYGVGSAAQPRREAGICCVRGGSCRNRELDGCFLNIRESGTQ